MSRLAPWAAASLLVACALAAPGVASTQSAVAPVASPMVLPGATRILAIGTLTARATATSVAPILEQEVPATLKLYLAGKIDAWYAKTDQTGVVFVLDVRTVEEAHALLEALPLGRAGMMTFDLIPLGPLRPLGMLLRQPAR